MGTVAFRHLAPDLALLELDLAAKGWNYTDLARRIPGRYTTNAVRISRFFSGDVQTRATLKLIAQALGKSPKRYLRHTGVAA